MGWRSVAVGLNLICGIGAAIAATPEFRPLKLKSFDRDGTACRAISAGSTVQANHVTIRMTIDANGEAGKLDASDEQPLWQRQLAECALEGAMFEPEMRDGKAIATKAQLDVYFEPIVGGLPDEVRVDDVRDLATAPRMRANSSSVFSRCLGRNAPADVAWRFVITAVVGKDGRIKTTKSPPNAPPWMLETLRCVEKDLKLLPGTHDGEAVEAEVSLPVHLVQDASGFEFEPAKPPKDRELIEAAYRACYPPDQLAAGSVLFNFDVTIKGEVSRARIVQGSGDPVLDKAATCILPRLQFEPSKRNGKPIQSNISWELPVRPPR